MKFLTFLILFSITLLGETLNGLVVRVSDGDTITVLDATKIQHRIRLYGIDAPESKQAFGRKSREYLSMLVASKNVRVEYKEYDRYNRILGKVYVGKTYVNFEMVAAGLAWHYAAFAPNENTFALAEQRARSEKIGLWADKSPTPPWEFRKLKNAAQQNQTGDKK